MAQTIKLKRSGTSGNIPTTSQLELGEVAINTYDGKMFIKKNVGGTESIVEISAAAADAILVEYQFTSTASQTTYTGSDDNSETLSYTPNAIQVFMNGILLDPGIDFTATNGYSIVLAEAADANDYLQIFAFKKKISDGQVSVDTFTGDDSTVAFTLSVDPGDENNTRVFIDGVYQSKANYSVSGTTLTFSTAPPTGTAVEVEIGNRVVTLDTLSDLDLPDSVRLRLGTGQDLQIYHDGSHSFISDTGTGSLYIKGGADVALRSDSDEDMLVASSNGAVTLYYDNSAKFATTNDGISVTGDVEATGEIIGDLRGATLFKAQAGESLAKGDVVYISGISGNTTVVSKADADDATKMPAFGLVAASASSGNPVDIYTAGILADIDTSSFSEGDELFVSTTAGALTATAPTGESAALQKIGKVTRSDATAGRIFIIGAGRSNAVPNLNEGRLFVGNSSNQAVADDTVHVDIANSRVGIGTTSPVSNLHVKTSVDNSVSQGIVVERSANTDRGYINYNGGGFQFRSTVGDPIVFGETDAEHMRIQPDGNVGIGTSSPGSILEITESNSTVITNNAAAGLTITNSDATSGTGAQISFKHADSNSNAVIAKIGGINDPSTTDDNGILTFATRKIGVGMVRRMTIDSNGNVGINTTTPGTTLDVDGNIRSNAWIGRTNTSAPTADAALYRPADNTIALSTASTERMRIDSNGYLFLGHSGHSWGTFHDVAQIGRTGAIANYDSGANQQTVITNNTYFGASGYTAITGDAAASYINLTQGDINFYTATTVTAGSTQSFNPAVVIKNSGNVGIGVTNPSTKLAVGGSLSVTSNITNNSAGHAYFVLNSGGVYESGIIYQRNSTSKWETYISSSNDDYKFYSYGDGDVQLEIRDGVDGNGGTILSGLGVNDSTAYYGSYGALILDSNASYTASARSWMVTNALKAYNFGILYSDSATTKPSLTTYGNAATGTSVALSIDNSGNVGIGTDSPFNSTNYKTLNIRGHLGGQILLGDSTNSYTGYLYSQSSGVVLGAVAGDRLEFHADGAEKMRLDSSGNLLIGTTTASAKLYAKTGAEGVITKFEGPAGRYVYSGTDGGGHYMEVVGTQASERVLRIQGSNGSGTYTQLVIDAGNQRIYTSSTANVGIGTATPSVNLQVQGGNSAFAAHFGQGQNNSSGNWSGISLGYNESNIYYRKVGIVAKATGDNAARQELHFLVDSVNDQNSATLSDSKMMINTGGLVAIGQTTAAARLDIKAGSVGEVGLNISRASSSGRAQFTLSDESGTNIWRVGMTGPASEDFAFFDGGANVVTLYRSTNGMAVSGDVAYHGGRHRLGAYHFSDTSSASGSTYYVHFKTTQATNSVQMTRWEFKGYNYGASSISECDWACHVDGSGNIYNKTYNSLNTSFQANNIYASSDGYVVLVAAYTVRYYVSGAINVIDSPIYTTQGSTISAHTITTSNSGAY